MTHEEYIKRFNEISAEMANLKVVPDPVTQRIAEVKIINRGITHVDTHNLQDLLDDNVYLAICGFIRDKIETRVEELEGQLEHLTREWLSCVELRRNEEVTA